MMNIARVRPVRPFDTRDENPRRKRLGRLYSETLNKSSPRRGVVVTVLAVYNHGLPLAGEGRSPCLI